MDTMISQEIFSLVLNYDCELRINLNYVKSGIM